MLLVDSGNLLFKPGDHGDNPVAMITAHGIVRTYNKLSYDAVAVSPQDLKAGADFFKTTSSFGFPWISANVSDEDGRPLFPPYLMVKREGNPVIAIIGVTGKTESPSWARVHDWRETLPELMAQLESVSGMLILLSNLSDDENQEIIQRFPQIDIIVTSSPTRRGNQLPVVVGRSLLTQADGRGKYLGKLDVNWHPQGSWLISSPAESQKHLESRIATIDLQIQKYREENSASHLDYEQKLTKMLNHKKSLLNQLSALETSIAEEMHKLVYRNSFDATFLPVRPLPSGDAVDAIVDDIKKSIAAYQKARLRQNGQPDKKTEELLQVTQFVGADTCKGCHEKQTAFWSQTAHARAFATLVSKGQNYNPECLPCHVTGGNITQASPYARKDLLLVLPETRQSVGCETCHGPGREHALDPLNIRLIRKKPSEKSCLNCHTPEHDDDFNYSAKMDKAACPLDSK